jgi:hypothetical protein
MMIKSTYFYPILITLNSSMHFRISLNGSYIFGNTILFASVIRQYHDCGLFLPSMVLSSRKGAASSAFLNPNNIIACFGVIRGVYLITIIYKPKLDFVALAMLFYSQKLLLLCVTGKRYETKIEA